MIKKTLKILAVSVGLLAATTATGQAATTTFDFTSTIRSFTTGSVQFVQDGLTLDVSAGFFHQGEVIDGGLIGFLGNEGMYHKTSYGDVNKYIGASGMNEVVEFRFSENVALKSVTFAREIGEGELAYFLDTDGNGALDYIDDEIDVPGEGETLAFLGSLLNVDDHFGLGAMAGGMSSYSIASITVEHISAVPLPPAVLLFAGALGGLGWFSRRRKKAGGFA